ncbi:NADH-quinone oxidoreductase subunit A [Pectinatus brassicae]|uniref:NADH-quinone oxidoreductase subunit A n=1 Tax=Pectinatus brassicae TaxID=862415 RepID=A0A840UVL6_9FIRM|nr:NADH-quinone oxidoreductase subunit A [Pectinatus brassicae]MBB5336485.1 NADH-quinone oxidoreductase subunit A [Pectinatus brassicae]
MTEFMKMLLLLVVAGVFPIMAMIMPLLIEPRQPNEEKNSQYECGVDTIGRNVPRYRISYFLYAIIFVVFDVETVFLFPWAVKFNVMGLFGLIEMFIFAGILAIGLAYAWKKGALVWK